MDKIVFADSWEQYFQRFGLSGFDDFYSITEGSVVNRNKKRNVQQFSFGDDGDRKVFFIKRFHHPHLKDIFSAACNFGGLISQAGVEWENAQYLLRNDIGTYKPICRGERSCLGIETASFFITEELEAVCLLDFVIEHWAGLDRSVQENIIIGIAEVARKIHELDVSFPDLCLWHFFISKDDSDGRFHFSIIDLHRMTQKCRGLGLKIKDLGRLYWSMSEDYFDCEHKELLIDTYMGGSNVKKKASLLKKIKRRSATLDKKRKLKDYYINS